MPFPFHRVDLASIFLPSTSILRRRVSGLEGALQEQLLSL